MKKLSFVELSAKTETVSTAEVLKAIKGGDQINCHYSVFHPVVLNFQNQEQTGNTLLRRLFQLRDSLFDSPRLGFDFCNELRALPNKEISTFKDEPMCYPAENQPLEFSYQLFKKANPLL